MRAHAHGRRWQRATFVQLQTGHVWYVSARRRFSDRAQAVRALCSKLTPARCTGGATALEGPDGGSQPAATAAGAYMSAEACPAQPTQSDRAHSLTLAACRHPARWRHQRCTHNGFSHWKVVEDRTAGRVTCATGCTCSGGSRKHDGCPGARMVHHESDDQTPQASCIRTPHLDSDLDCSTRELRIGHTARLLLLAHVLCVMTRYVIPW
jgi:hypothetical protein